MAIPLPINPMSRPTRPSPNKRRAQPPVPSDVTFDPKDPFRSYKKMLQIGPPASWPTEKRDQWQRSMERWFANAYPLQMT